MTDYASCPNCGRKAKKALSSNYFPVYKCHDCGKKYCEECGGSICPSCGSSRSTQAGKVYAK